MTLRNRIFVLTDGDMASLGNQFLIFYENLMVSSTQVNMSKTNGIVTHEDHYTVLKYNEPVTQGHSVISPNRNLSYTAAKN